MLTLRKFDKIFTISVWLPVLKICFQKSIKHMDELKVLTDFERREFLYNFIIDDDHVLYYAYHKNYFALRRLLIEGIGAVNVTKHF